MTLFPKDAVPAGRFRVWLVDGHLVFGLPGVFAAGLTPDEGRAVAELLQTNADKAEKGGK